MRTLNWILNLTAGVLLLSSCGKTASLPRAASPAAERAIDAYLAAMNENELDPHSVMLVKNGRVIGERWVNGWTADKPHPMYSVSKTFTVMGLGIAVKDGLLSVEDKVTSFFPEEVRRLEAEGKGPDSLMQVLAVRHLLCMASGQAADVTKKIREGEDPAWTKAFLAEAPECPPGSRFRYNSMATYILSAILQKVTGEKLLDYLFPRLLEPMGIARPAWEESPEGVNCGGWGLEATTEDMAKLGLLLLQKGRWQGRQLVPADWVRACTAYRIATYDPDAPEEEKAANRIDGDWIAGYGYQMWRGLHGSVRADGAYGQFIILLPERHAEIVVTARSKNNRKQMALIWEHLLPAVK